LNYDDTEEMPSNEGMDKCHLFDMDIETLPLYQPRDTVGATSTMEFNNPKPSKNKRELDNSFDFSQDIRYSCPENVRA
jgi:hypothetical protein